MPGNWLLLASEGKGTYDDRSSRVSPASPDFHLTPAASEALQHLCSRLLRLAVVVTVFFVTFLPRSHPNILPLNLFLLVPEKRI